MMLIPEVKESVKGKKRVINGYEFSFLTEIDERVKNLCNKTKKGNCKVTVSVNDKNEESYSIDFSEETVKVVANGQAGAFYAIQTLRQILKNGYCDLSRINDSPDFKIRGFYFDVTRGRVPKIEALKELVDNLSYYKTNMLQLYIEHSFELKEYNGIYQKTGYITAEEIKELDRYCYENFIELVPSLSCFGHLYELLQSDKYKDLCELENYKPSSHYSNERMRHHTIDASNKKSEELVISMISQYAPLFRTNKFNICCDETFDLCSGRNKGKEKDELYLSFVNKLVDYLHSIGKIPMMWGDIIGKSEEMIDRIHGDVIFLNWNYSDNPKSDLIEKTAEKGKEQFVCPGISNWTGLIEVPQISVPNIDKMVLFGLQNSAKGFLNTCWGDYLHLSPIYACMYGIIYGCAKSWNSEIKINDFNKAIDYLYYGYKGASKLMLKISGINRTRFWYFVLSIYSNEIFSNYEMKNETMPKPNELEKAFKQTEDIIPYLMASVWENEDARNALLLVAEGTEYLSAILMSAQVGVKMGINNKDVEQWIKDYTELYLKESKESELKEIVHIMYYLAQKYLK